MCYFCGEAVPADRVLGFGETCPTCGKDLHVCLMCSFYAPQARWACRETVDAQVVEKDRRNFCDFFRLAPGFKVASAGDPRARSKAGAAKSAFDALFGKS
jgi:hypothetical protein